MPLIKGKIALKENNIKCISQTKCSSHAEKKYTLDLDNDISRRIAELSHTYPLVVENGYPHPDLLFLLLSPFPSLLFSSYFTLFVI